MYNRLFHARSEWSSPGKYFVNQFFSENPLLANISSTLF